MLKLFLDIYGFLFAFISQLFFQTIFINQQSKRKHYNRRIIISIAVGSILSVLASLPFYFGLSKRFNFLFFSLVYLISAVCLFFLYKIKPIEGLTSIFYCTFSIQVVRTIVKLLVYFVRQKSELAATIISPIFFTILSLVLIFLMKYYISKKNINFEYVKLWQMILFVVGGSICMLLTIFEDALEEYNVSYYIAFIVCEMGCDLLILLSQLTFVIQTNSELEKIATEKIAKESEKQYQKLLENINIINIKAHDLKHFSQIQSSSSEDLYKLATEYDCFIHTNNQALDVVLTEKAMKCNIKNIQFTCIADGKLIDFMSRDDIVSFFSNALDNAIEYEENQNIENRFIDVKLFSENENTQIHIENYFTGKLNIKNGILKSSKNDDIFHGFGVKSMKMIAEKYKGIFSYKVEDDMFQVDVLFLKDR